MLISKNWIVRLLQNAGNKDFNPTDEELDAVAHLPLGDPLDSMRTWLSW